MAKRDKLLIFLALAMAVTAVSLFFRRNILPTASWGLSFRQEGAPPVGNADRQQLRQFDAAYLGDPSQKVLYLTFDAGYENGSTEKILDILKEQQVSAAFFWWATTSRKMPIWCDGWRQRVTSWATTPCTIRT